jgi:hypothetical protein
MTKRAASQDFSHPTENAEKIPKKLFTFCRQCGKILSWFNTLAYECKGAMLS